MQKLLPIRRWRIPALFLALGLVALLLRSPAWLEMQLTTFSQAVDLEQATFWGKSAWDWAGLLIVPSLLALGAFLAQRFLEGQEARRQAKDEELAADRSRQEELKDYLDRMTQLLLDENWPREIDLNDEDAIAQATNRPIVVVVRARTLAVMRELDGKRNGYVTRFLSEVNALPFVPLNNLNLDGANLREANLQGANLRGANLRGANLRGADLSKANLNGANLSGAKLGEANLSGASLLLASLNKAYLFKASLSGTDLSSADLSGADLREVDLTETQNLTADQVKAASNWEQARYPDAFTQQLSLPSTKAA